MKKLFTLLTASLLILGASYASFPVKKGEESKQTQTISSESVTAGNSIEMTNPEVSKNLVKKMKNKKSSSAVPSNFWKYFLLWFFLGGLAIHRWVAGKPAGWNILFILTAGGCGVWAIFDLIHIIKGDNGFE